MQQQPSHADEDDECPRHVPDIGGDELAGKEIGECSTEEQKEMEVRTEVATKNDAEDKPRFHGCDTVMMQKEITYVVPA